MNAEFVRLTQRRAPTPPDRPGDPLKATGADTTSARRSSGVFTDLSGQRRRLGILGDHRTRCSSARAALLAAMIWCWLAAVALLALYSPGTADGVPAPPFPPPRWWSMKPLDALVTAILVWMAASVGANTSDDGCYIPAHRRGLRALRATMALTYYRWFGTGAPFGWYRDLLALWAHVGTASVWMPAADPADGLACWWGDQSGR